MIEVGPAPYWKRDESCSWTDCFYSKAIVHDCTWGQSYAPSEIKSISTKFISAITHWSDQSDGELLAKAFVSLSIAVEFISSKSPLSQKNRKESKQRLMMILLDIKRKESWEKNWKITCVDHLISAYLQELAKRSWSKVDTPMSNQNIILCDLLEIKLIRFSLSVLCLLSSLIRLRANDSPS